MSAGLDIIRGTSLAEAEANLARIPDAIRRADELDHLARAAATLSNLSDAHLVRVEANWLETANLADTETGRELARVEVDLCRRERHRRIAERHAPPAGIDPETGEVLP